MIIPGKHAHLRAAAQRSWELHRGKPGFTIIQRGGPFDGVPARLTGSSYPMGCTVGLCVEMPRGPHLQVLYRRTWAGWWFDRAVDNTGIVSGTKHGG